jgi:hypothetical protein
MTIKVFLSSTSLDLKEHRAAVIDMLRQTNNLPIAMENFGSKVGDATSVSLKEVQKADLFVGIYAHRYGYRPDDGKISVTEMEYDEAVDQNIPRLIFIVDENYDDPVSLIHQHKETDNVSQMLLAFFMQRLNKENVRSLFTTPDDLKKKVQHAIMNWQQDQLQKKRSGAAKETPKPAVNIQQTVQNNKGNVVSGIGTITGNINQGGNNPSSEDEE